MRNSKKIIISSCCIELFFIISSFTTAQSVTDNLPNTWDLVRQEMTKKTEPNELVQSSKSSQPTTSDEPVKAAESAKPVVVAETAQSLLDKYAQTQAKLRTSYISKEEDISEAEVSLASQSQYRKGVKYKSIYKMELRSDSENYYSSDKHWGDNPNNPTGKETEDQVAYNDVLWNGEARFQCAEHPDITNPTVRLTLKEDMDMKKNHLICDTQSGGPIRGYFPGSSVRIDIELKNVDSISIRPKKEKIGISDCFVIDAKTKKSEYVIWIDPGHDFNIAQARVKRNYVTYGDPNGYKNPPTGTRRIELKNVVFKQLDGVWLSVECDYSVNVKQNNGDGFSENHHHKITEFLINPDHKALRSFDPSRFIINGAKVIIMGGVQGNYIWKDGRVLDSYGYEVNLSTLKRPSLVGKTLPSIAEFGVALEPEVFKNNKLLLCFFDYSQRPSRNCVLTLNEKAQSLLDKDIFLIFIQADSVTEQTLASWLTKNQIVPPVGTSKIDLPELAQRWGVQALPWLILTDKQHNVTAEGFSVNELEKVGISDN